MIKYFSSQGNLFSSKGKLDKRMIEYQHIRLLSDAIIYRVNIDSALCVASTHALRLTKKFLKGNIKSTKYISP